MSFWVPRGGKLRSRSLILEQLEERIMLDAAPVAPTPDHVDQHEGPIEATGELGACVAEPATASAGADPIDAVYEAALAHVIIAAAPDQVLSAANVDSGLNHADPARVLVVSSDVQGADALVSAAQSDILTIVYDPSEQSPAGLLTLIEHTLDGRKAESIAFATHELGTGQFQLSEGFAVNAVTLETNPELLAFWGKLGHDLTENGRIDLLVCDLAGTEQGALLISRLEGLTGAEVAASSDATGNPSNGGDWILETHDLDLVPVYFVNDRLERFEGTLAVEWYTIVPIGGRPGDQFGYGVSIDGNTIVAGGMEQSITGAQGAAYVFEFDGTNWVQKQKIVSAYTFIEDYGISTAISEDTLVVGDLYTSYNYTTGYSYYPAGKVGTPGSAHVFELQSDVWLEIPPLWPYDPSNPASVNVQLHEQEQFGRSIAVLGDTVVVSAISDSFTTVGGVLYEGTGAIYVYGRDEGGPDAWGLVQRIAPDLDPLLPSNIGGKLSDYFGYSVAMDTDTMIVGSKLAKWDYPATSYSVERNGVGAAYVFELDSTGTWVQDQKFTGHDVVYGDQFGQSLAMYGDAVVVSADYRDVGGVGDSGAAYVFKVDPITGKYVETQELVASDGGTGDRFGRYCAMSEDYIIVSAHKADTAAGKDAGAVYVFKYDPATESWGVKNSVTGFYVENMKLTPSDATAKDYFGTTVALYDDPTLGAVLVVGSPHYDDATKAGKVYVITLDDAPPPPTPLPPTPDIDTGLVTEGGNTYEYNPPFVEAVTGSDGNTYEYSPLVVEGPTGSVAATTHATDIGQVHSTPWLLPHDDLRYDGFGGDHAAEHPGEAHSPSAESVTAHSPHGKPVDEPIGLYGFHEQLAAGKLLVFNLDDFHFTDLTTDLVVFPSAAKDGATGLSDYAQAIKAGKALMFNLDEITFMDVLTAGGEPT